MNFIRNRWNALVGEISSQASAVEQGVVSLEIEAGMLRDEVKKLESRNTNLLKVVQGLQAELSRSRSVTRNVIAQYKAAISELRGIADRLEVTVKLEQDPPGGRR